MNNLEPFKELSAIIQVRPVFNGNSLKSNQMLNLNGKEVKLRVLWRFDDDDSRYPGEYALEAADAAACDILRSMGIIWIASGDLIIKESIYE